MEHFAARSDRMIVVHYEDMRADKEAVMRKVCAFFGVPFEAGMSDSSYRRNTAFRSEAERSEALAPNERKLIRRWARWSALIPRCVLAAGWRCLRRAEGRSVLPPWFFALLPFVKEEAERKGKLAR